MISDLQVWQAEMGLLFLAIICPLYAIACCAVLLIQQWRKERAERRKAEQDERDRASEGRPSSQV